MNKSEKLRLIHALMKAQNAYHKALREEGYHLESGLGKDFLKGRKAIIDDHKAPTEFRIVGYVTITKEYRK